jgi:iron-sulfur cluster assembly accessory protein
MIAAVTCVGLAAMASQRSGKEEAPANALDVTPLAFEARGVTMEYAEKVNPSDEVVEDKGVRILVDPKAVLFLIGTEMDYRIDKLSAQFVFNNPNQTSACGCGESVALTPASGETVHTH